MDSSSSRWVTFLGCVLVVAVLYWGQTVLVPVALALLITFVLTPPVSWLQRRVGRFPAVLAGVLLVFAVLGLAGWGMWRQLGHLAEDLPGHRANIRQKIVDIRGAGKGGSVEKIQETIQDIQTEIAESESPRGSDSRPFVVQPQQVASLWGFPSWLGPFIAPLSTAGFVLVLVVFMLLERDELRGRLISVVGHGHLAVTTKAFDDAGRGVSRQLMMQSLVNLIHGTAVFAGLYLLGVPYALLWGVSGAALRFVPYFGPLVAAGAPILLSLASAPGWERAAMVIGFFVALELFTNLVLETKLYAGSVGVSQVALLISVAFWSWLWGLPGLLMAMPLTVCLAVLGKHVRGLEFISTLLADTPALSPEMSFYQRLLARDFGDAADLIDRHSKSEPADSVYDALVLPALNYAERDRLEGRLSAEDEVAVIDAIRDLLGDAPPGEAGGPPLQVTAVAANGAADELALRMLGHLLIARGIALDVLSQPLMTSDIVAIARKNGSRLVCIADLPPSAPSRTRYLVQKLRAALPDLQILVGRWAPTTMAGDDEVLLRSGANHVASTLLQSRDRIAELATVLRPAVPEPRAGAAEPAA
ncbi:MAG: AI-2E family transporter [Vicinamibacteria bacterium]